MENLEKPKSIPRQVLDLTEPRIFEDWRKLLNNLSGKNIIKGIELEHPEDSKRIVSFDEFNKRLLSSSMIISAEEGKAFDKARQMLIEAQKKVKKDKESIEKPECIIPEVLDLTEPRTFEDWIILINGLSGKKIIKSIDLTNLEDSKRRVSFDEFSDRLMRSTMPFSSLGADMTAFDKVKREITEAHKKKPTKIRNKQLPSSTE
jgi:FtsZ-interacting cell division protein YlmF